MSCSEPTMFLTPGQSHVVDGFDWSWAYVLFRPIPGLGDYLVDTEGRVWSRRVPRGHGMKTGGQWQQLKSPPNPSGYSRVCLYRGPQQRTVKTVHALVLETFIGPCPPGMEGCHFPDHSRTNSRLWNLRWDTAKGNHSDQYAHGTKARGSEARGARLTEEDIPEIFRMRAAGHPHRLIARFMDVDTSVVTRILQRKVWRHVRLESV